MRHASSAGTSSPKKNSSFAFCGPTSCVTRYGPPPSGMRPRRTKISMNRAVSAAITRSHANATCAPSPAAVPFTAAMIGFGQSCNAMSRRCAPRLLSSPFITVPIGRSGAPGYVRCSDAAAARRSPPVQKCRSPLAVSTIARTPRSAPASSRCARMWLRCSRVSEFPASGRLRVSHATPLSSTR